MVQGQECFLQHASAARCQTSAHTPMPQDNELLTTIIARFRLDLLSQHPEDAAGAEALARLLGRAQPPSRIEIIQAITQALTDDANQATSD